MKEWSECSEIFAQRLRELRKERRLTQKELAEEIGVTQSCISFMERQRKPRLFITTIMLADYFGISLDYLIGRKDTREI